MQYALFGFFRFSFLFAQMLRLRHATTVDLKSTLNNQSSFQATRRNRSHFSSIFRMPSTSAAAGTSVNDRIPAVHAPSSPTLGFDSGPLVWVDLEMTGLNVHKDEIMEIAVS